MPKKVFIRNINNEMDGLSYMLTTDQTTPMLEFFQDINLDFSLASLLIVEQYLARVRGVITKQDDRGRIIFRAGAYLGQVIRRNAKSTFVWYDFKQAAMLNQHIKQFGECLETKAVLISGQNTVLFPLNKIKKFLENGSEDSIHYFASAVLNGAIENAPGCV